MANNKDFRIKNNLFVTGLGTSTFSGDVSVGDTLTVQGATTFQDEVNLNSALNASSLSLSGNATISGNLTVSGTTTWLDSTNTQIKDANIVLNYSTGDSSANANGAGITIQDAVNSSTDATFTWNSSANRWEASNALLSSGDFTSLGFVQSYGDFFSRSNLRVLNAAGNGWTTWATRASGTYNLSNLGTISSGAITSSGTITSTGNGVTNVMSFSDRGIFGTTSNHPIEIRANGTEAIRIDTAQLIGIGTSSPGFKLDLVNAGTQLGSSGFYANARFKDTDNVGVFLGHNNTSNGVGMLAGINDLAFLTYSGSWGERMRISGANVGIGTTHPDSRLDVTGGDITVNTTGTGFMNFKYNNGSTGTIGTDGIDLKITANADLQLQPTGNVGIRTASPSERLHINGGSSDVALRVDTTNADPKIRLTTLGQQDWSLGVDYSDGGKFKINESGTVGTLTALTIDASRNVGIGTESPNAKLDVAGDITVTGDMTMAGSSPTLRIPAHSGIEIDITGSASSGNIRANTDLFLLSQNGSINLGANGTNSILSINTAGNATFTGTISSGAITSSGVDNLLYLQSGATGTPTLRFEQGTTRRAFLRYQNANSNFDIINEYGGVAIWTGTSGSESQKVLVDSAGRVGIGTQTPNQILVVSDNSGETTLAINNSTTTTGNHARLDFRHNAITGSQIKSENIEDFTSQGNRTSNLTFHTRNNGGIIDSLRIKETGDLSLPDNLKFMVGNGDDLQIYHSSNFNFILSPSVPTVIGGTTISLKNAATTENMLVATENGSVDLYYNNVKRLETTSSGVNMVNGLTVQGTTEFNDDVSFGAGIVSNINAGTNTITSGAISATGNVTVRSGNKLVVNRTDNAIGGEISYEAGSGWKINDANGDGTRFFTGSTERARFDGSGNFGIGTDSPSEKLHIASSAADHLTLKLEQDNASYEAWFEANSQDGGYFRAGIGTNAFNYAFFNTDQASYRWFGAGGGSPSMTLTNGNLGLGTTAPSETLDVVGTAEFILNNQSNGVRIRQTDSTPGQNMNSLYIDHDCSGSDTFSGDFVHRGIYVDIDTSATGGDTSEEHRVYAGEFDARATGDSDLVKGIRAYAESQHSSGTISGIYGLEGIAIADETGSARTTAAYGVSGLVQYQGTGTGGTTAAYGVYGRVLHSTSSDRSNVGQSSGVYAEIEIDDPGQSQTLTNTQRVIYSIFDNDSGGNVDISGRVSLVEGTWQGTLPTNAYNLYFPIDVPSYIEGSLGIGTASANSFWSQANSLVLDDGGNTGLTIRSTSTGNGRVVFTDTASTTAGLNDGGQIHYGHSADDMRFRTAGADRVTINATGVGIGTTSPAYKVHQAVSDSGVNYLGFTNSTTGSAATDGLKVGINEYEEALIWNHENSAIRFATNNTQRMAILNNGNVGIGQTSPATKLDVSGFMRTTLGAVFQGQSNISTGVGLEVGYSGALSKSFLQSYDRTNSAYKGINYYGADHTFLIGSSSAFTVTASGTAAIGTITAPAFKTNGTGGYFISTTQVISNARVFENIAALNVDGSSAKSVFTNTSNSLIDLSSAPSGALQIGTGSSTLFATIGARQTNSSQTGLGFYSATTDANSSAVGDMHFNVRENNDTDFATTTKKAFTFRRYSTELLSIRRDGNLTIVGDFFMSQNKKIGLGGYSFAKFDGTNFLVGSLDDDDIVTRVKGFGGTTELVLGDGAVTITGNTTISGSLSKSSGSFKIDHPLKPDTHHLVHSFVEGPQADNLYRGKIELKDGRAVIDLDEWFGMTPGTFLALNRDLQAFVSNEEDWDAVRAKVMGSQLVIECQNARSKASVSWLVVGERQDNEIYESTLTDDYGKIIVEPVKQVVE